MSDYNLPKVICLIGPTAAGKTELAISLANRFPCEIISVDSAMVYRGMNIGTAKPEPEILAQIPHHLIDICDVTQPYSAARFCEDAQQLIKNIYQKGKIPLLTGGTMLYFRSLQHGLSPLPASNPVIRERLQKEQEAFGLSGLYQRLKEIDPVAAQRIHPNDPQRILRALEVYDLTQKNLTDWHQSGVLAAKVQSLNIIVAPSSRELLHERIAKRFLSMLAVGFIDEVAGFYHRPEVTEELPAMRSVGYRQVWQYLDGKLSYEELKQQGITATRQLAKRQLTWLRSWDQAEWFNSDQTGHLEKIIGQIEKILPSRY